MTDRDMDLKKIENSFEINNAKPQWKVIIQKELEKQYFIDLMMYVNRRYCESTVYPPKNKVFEIFSNIDLSEVKVVILGQDPYHGQGQANGMCFSVSQGVKTPPSLKNIFKEIENEMGIIRTNTELRDWVDQGVFLLNSILTVEQSLPGSHKNLGWENFTDNIVYHLNKREQPIVFILWGNYAIKKAGLIDSRHLVLTSNHPSPFSCHKGFFGNKHFILANQFLEKHYGCKIAWA